MSIKTRKVSDLPIVEETAYYANVLIEEGGSTKRVPLSQFVKQEDFATDEEILAMMLEMDALPTLVDADGDVLIGADNTILLI